MAERDPKTGRFPKRAPAVSAGKGWGGGAKGAPHRERGPGRPVGVKNGEGKRAMARAALEEAAPMAVDTVIGIARDASDQRALQAALSILNRVGLHEKSGVELTGADSGPMQTKVTIEIVEPENTGPAPV